MATQVIQTAFTSGEVSPSLWGREDLERLHTSMATARNMVVRFTGGAFSRPGTSYVGYSKQTGRNYPPRLLTFQFNINQGLALEFGNNYMRPIYQGAFVTEAPLAVTGATQADPLVITVTGNGGISATSNDGSVTSSYAPGDIIALAGGTFTTQAQLQVNTTKLLSLTGSPAVGFGYVPNDTVTLYGGAFTTAAVVTVITTQVSLVLLQAAGTGGTQGSAVVTGTTGNGTKVSLNVIIDSTGKISQILGFVNRGAYTTNPSNLGHEPVTGGSLSGAAVSFDMCPNTVSITNPGVFTSNPSGGNMYQSSSSGTGLGATFINGLFGPLSVSFSVIGQYSAFPSNPAQQAETSGNGAGANFTVSWGSVAPYAVGDWLYLSGETGMTQINGRTAVVSAVSGDNLSLKDIYGNNIDATAFSPFAGGGTAARYYTTPTPYGEADLAWLKITQSADEMFIGCVNQDTNTEYPPMNLTRYLDSLFLFRELLMQATVNAPAACSGAATPQPVGTTDDSSAYYQYCFTAVSPSDGSESLPSPIANIPDAVDITVTAGTISLVGSPVNGVSLYNWYKATPVYAGSLNGATTPPPVGAEFGYIGSSYGPLFNDTNVIADFSQVPPTHQDPFARGVLLPPTPTAGGSAYTYAVAFIGTGTGEDGQITPVIEGGSIVAYVVANEGRNYLPSDTITIYGDGTGAAASLNVGPQSGTYPASPQFDQQRLAWGYSLNNPDTYNMSQPGAFTNFDVRSPVIDSDAIQGTPWSQQVNGIQFMILMPGGLVVLTGLGAWQVTGAGGSSLNPTSLTPSNQQAQPQSFNGCSPTIPPIRINFDIIYVQAKGYTYRDLAYQFFTNIYTGTDMTVNSGHLFLNYEIKEHAWCEEPFKVIWSVRTDGVMLSCTYLKEQNVLGWARHDTNGQFVTVCSVIEPPVDALYVGTSRLLGPSNSPTYVIERMDNGLWTGVESTWCVDCGLTVGIPTPNATLSAASTNGVGSLTGVTSLVGGQLYSSGTTATIVDANGTGPGTGAVPVLTIVEGSITAVTFFAGGAGYVAPQLVIVDPAGTGQGASATVTLNSTVEFSASANVFSSGSVNHVIRMGNGVATITGYVSPTQVNAELTTPISTVIPNSGGVVPAAPPGTWSLGNPTSVVYGLIHLAGQTVTGLYDGNVIPPTVVSALGVLNLPGNATAITVGLGFQAQFQSVDLDVGAPTIQGQRKKVAAVTVRAESSRGIKAGSNQPNGSTFNPILLAPTWSNLDAVPDLIPPPYNGSTAPLWTGDVRVTVQGGYAKPGQVCLQQDNPLPMNVLAIIPEVLEGDEPDSGAMTKSAQARGGARQ